MDLCWQSNVSATSYQVQKKTGQQEYWKLYRARPLNHSGTFMDVSASVHRENRNHFKDFKQRGLWCRDLKRVVNIRGREVECAGMRKLLSSLLPLPATITTERESRSLHSTEEPTHHLTAAAENTSDSALRTAPSPLRIQALRSARRSWLSHCCSCPKQLWKLGGNDFLFPLPSPIFYQDIIQNHL